MGPSKYRGIGRGSGVVAAPTTPDSGSGGAGTLSVPAFSFAAATTELSDVQSGRITLGIVNFAILGLIAFYIWTRSMQGAA